MRKYIHHIERIKFAVTFYVPRADKIGLVPILRNAWNRSKHFVTKAGKIIFVVTVVIWVLGYFPNMGEDLGASWLGWLGRWIEARGPRPGA